MKTIPLALLFALMCTALNAQNPTIRGDSTSVTKENDYVLGNSVVTNFLFHPAYAGVEEKHNLNITYTRLWLGLKGAPWELNIAFDGPFGKRKMGIGASFTIAKIGRMTVYRIEICESIRINLPGKSKLSLGFSLSPLTGFHIAEIGNYFTFGDQIHPRYGFIYETNEDKIPLIRSLKIILDGGAGGWFSHPDFYAGASLMHIFQLITLKNNRGNILERSLNITLNFTGGFHLKINKKLTISPSLSISYIFKNALYYEPYLLFIYQRKYLLGFSSNLNFSNFALKAGGILNNHVRLILSLGYYTNAYLHDITGPAFINGNIRGQL